MLSLFRSNARPCFRRVWTFVPNNKWHQRLALSIYCNFSTYTFGAQNVKASNEHGCSPMVQDIVDDDMLNDNEKRDIDVISHAYKEGLQNY